MKIFFVSPRPSMAVVSLWKLPSRFGKQNILVITLDISSLISSSCVFVVIYMKSGRLLAQKKYIITSHQTKLRNLVEFYGGVHGSNIQSSESKVTSG
mmetsp:Transcript_46338/g.63070  ORF Transcript_46338/g.63070 Transcript_46338/m.63070 type:complete len:97 (+) Transcript_46338:153-443(+)